MILRRNFGDNENDPVAKHVLAADDADGRELNLTPAGVQIFEHNEQSRRVQPGPFGLNRYGAAFSSRA